MTAFISATDLSVHVDQQTLLDSVNFAVSAGQVLAVTGLNGSGKTTLLRVLAGLRSPSTGTVSVAGAPPSERSPEFRSRVAALIGAPPMARDLTLREHLVLVGASWGQTLEAAEEHADSLLAELQIGRLTSRFPHELSSGQAQMFAFALTLSRPFDVLLLDEPEQRLDPSRVSLVAALLRAYASTGTTIIAASHNDALINQVADRVLTLTDPT